MLGKRHVGICGGVNGGLGVVEREVSREREMCIDCFPANKERRIHFMTQKKKLSFQSNGAASYYLT